MMKRRDRVITSRVTVEGLLGLWDSRVGVKWRGGCSLVYIFSPDTDNGCDSSLVVLCQPVPPLTGEIVTSEATDWKYVI